MSGRKSDLFVIDGEFLVRASEEAFQGCPLLVSADGSDNTKLYGFLRDLLRLRRQLNIRTATVIFHKGAKAAAGGDTFGRLVGLLKELKIQVWCDETASPELTMARFSNTARWYVSDNYCLAQLTGSGASLIVPAARDELTVVTPEYLRAQFGIGPKDIPDLLALSTGEKPLMTRRQAAKFLRVYGPLSQLELKKAKGTGLLRKVMANLETILQRRELLSISVPKRADGLGECAEAELFREPEHAASVLRRFGFFSLERFIELSSSDQPLKLTIEAETTFGHQVIKNQRDFRKVEKALLASGVCALDTETSGKDPRDCDLFGISFSVGADETFYIPLVESQLDGITVGQLLKKIGLLLTKDINVVGHNLKFDLQVLAKRGVTVAKPYFDTMLAAHECFGDLDFFNLGHLAKKCLGRNIKRYRDIVSDGETFLDVPFSDLVEHACTDAEVAFQLYRSLEKELKSRRLLEGFLKVRMPLMRELTRLEGDGVAINQPAIEERRATFVSALSQLQAELQSSFGASIDPGSLKSVREHLIKIEGIREEIGTRSISPSLLEDLALRKGQVACIVKIRRLRQQIKELDGLIAEIHDGKVFSQFIQTRNAHGLIASDAPKLDEAFAIGAICEPALQGNWSDRGRALGRLKAVVDDSTFCADAGGTFLEEPCTDDPALREVNRGDLLLSVLLSASNDPVCRKFLLPRHVVSRMRREFELRYPGVFHWNETVKRMIIDRGYAEYGGKRRYLDGLRSSDLNRRNQALTSALRWILSY